ncbi:MAG: hypothetical protein ABSG88_16580 [Bradyrhizobium sp.]
MKVAFEATKPVSAQKNLDDFYANADNRQKLEAGNVETRRAFDQLVTAAAAEDPVKVALGTVLPDLPSSSLRQMSEAAVWLRQLGIRESVVEQALRGTPETQEAFDYVTQWKADRLADPEWTKRWLAGGEKEKREMVLASIVLAAGPKKEAA